MRMMCDRTETAVICLPYYGLERQYALYDWVRHEVKLSGKVDASRVDGDDQVIHDSRLGAGASYTHQGLRQPV